MQHGRDEETLGAEDTGLTVDCCLKKGLVVVKYCGQIVLALGSEDAKTMARWLVDAALRVDPERN